MSANKECELPAADSCAIMEGEGEENEDDEVVFAKKLTLMDKLKAIATKGNKKSGEAVQLQYSHTEKSVWG